VEDGLRGVETEAEAAPSSGLVSLLGFQQMGFQGLPIFKYQTLVVQDPRNFKEKVQELGIKNPP
jgi:hypothetical protein